MLSIVIPLYNKAHTIINTLNSVTRQTFKDFEVLIINDGSTDNGVKLIKEFINDKRIQIIEQKNQGVSVARNKGVEYSKNDYIAFLDADDEWLPDYLENMIQAIKIFPDAGLYCCARIERSAYGSEKLMLAKKYINKIVEINFFENPHVFLQTSATIVSKTAFNEAGKFPVGMKRNEDFALFYSLALKASVVYIGKPLSIYVGGVEGQATSSKTIDIYKHVINRYNHVFNNWKKIQQKNRGYEIFLRYELRHEFIASLRSKSYNQLDLFLKDLNPEILLVFPKLELRLYKTRILRKISIIYILLTKLLWRSRGYPRVS